MSLPTNPLNRKEAYLNAIATGNTVDMPAKPITREEAYLDAIAKNGGGSGGAENYAQLSGKPQINNVELASGNNSLSALGIQGKLTFDNVPTDGSNNPVKSDGIYDSEKDIYAVMGKMSAKNLLVPKWDETKSTENGVAYTFNADGTIVMNTNASGATANTNCNLKGILSTDNIYPPGTYRFSGCPIGGTNTTYRAWLRAYKPSDSSSPLTDNLYDEGNGVTFTVNETFQLFINVSVLKNYVCNNLTWKPMLRLASDTDDTYQQYAKTNKQLTDEIANKVDKVEGKGLSTNDYSDTEKGKVADNASAIEAIVNVTGACNILPFPYAESSKTDVDTIWTVNKDGTVRVTGTNNYSNWVNLYLVGTENNPLAMNKLFPCAGDYIISCQGVTTGQFNCDFIVLNGSTAVISDNIPSTGKKYTITDEMLQYNTYLRLGVAAWTSDSFDVTFKPMLYDARLNPTGYVSPAMTNEQLTDNTVNKIKVRMQDVVWDNGLAEINFGDGKDIAILYIYTMVSMDGIIFSVNRVYGNSRFRIKRSDNYTGTDAIDIVYTENPIHYTV